MRFAKMEDGGYTAGANMTYQAREATKSKGCAMVGAEVLVT